MVMEEDLGGYDSFLRSELDKLFESLIQQHQAELEKRDSVSSVRSAEPQTQNHSTPSSPTSRHGSAYRSQSKETTSENGAIGSLASFPSSENSTAVNNWGVLTRSLIVQHHEEFEDSDSDDDQQMSYAKDMHVCSWLPIERGT